MVSPQKGVSCSPSPQAPGALGFDRLRPILPPIFCLGSPMGAEGWVQPGAGCTAGLPVTPAPPWGVPLCPPGAGISMFVWQEDHSQAVLLCERPLLRSWSVPRSVCSTHIHAEPSLVRAHPFCRGGTGVQGALHPGRGRPGRGREKSVGVRALCSASVLESWRESLGCQGS